MASSADPDQTAPLGVVRSGSTLCAKAFILENLSKIWYFNLLNVTIFPDSPNFPSYPAFVGTYAALMHR